MTDDVPHCPANSKCSDVGIGYETFAKNLKSFQELEQMPVPIDIEKLSIEDLRELFMNHATKWHKKCRDKFNATKLQRMKKKLSKDNTDKPVTVMKTTRCNQSAASSTSDNKCFFCELGKDTGDLRKASTFKVDERVRKCAHILEDTLLLGKLSSGDMIAQDAVYHINCLSTLYRKAEKAHLMDETDNTERQLHGIALAELVSYIDETRDNKDEV